MIENATSVEALYAERGRMRYGEAVTQEEHALQCAALARASGADDELVVAALLHDIGHLLVPPRGDAAPMGETPSDHHGGSGAALLRVLLPERVAWIVEHHVVAKRYLCAVEPEYMSGLSPASIRSLAAQGGQLDAAECRRLEAHPWFLDAVRLRRWDDLAKAPFARVPRFGAYAETLARLAR